LENKVTPEILALFKPHEQVAGQTADGHQMYASGTEIPLSPRLKEIDEYTLDEIREICKRRGGIESDSKREKETDYEIAHSLGFRVHEFNKLIKRLVVGV